MPVLVKAYTCQWKCGHVAVKSKSRMQNHEYRCFKNPERRACITCRFFNAGCPGMNYIIPGNAGYEHDPGESRHCTAETEHDIQHKLLADCQDWEAKP